MELIYHQQIPHPTPQDFLRKWKIPHSVINDQPSKFSENDFQILNNILNIEYNDKDAMRKAEVLKQLKQIVIDWMMKASMLTELPKRCGLEIFGSYKLGSSSFDSDIDAVCIVPPQVNRQRHFFVDLVAIFEKHPKVEEVFPIPMALVPLIKIKFHSIQFDILMSQIDTALLDLPYQKFFAENTLDEIPDKQLKSINGCRVAYYLKQNVKNYESFTIALKAIKMWAKNRGVYSQIFCYLGGIGYTILLAKICQLYPNYSPLKLLERFFYIYSRWFWEIPVNLENLPDMDDNKPNQRIQVTIMTPVSPSMNAARSISRSTLAITRREFLKASRIIDEITKGKKVWQDLFKPVNFFQKYKYFLEIIVFAKNSRQFMNWKGNIQSKLRKFIKLMENVDYSVLVIINPNPRQFPYTDTAYPCCRRYYFGIRCQPSVNNQDDCKEVDFAPAVRSFLTGEQAIFIDKLPDMIQISIRIIRKQQITHPDILNSTNYYQFQ